jgi:hypothetical protein
MQDAPETPLTDGRTPLWSRENLKRVTAAAPVLRPAMRYVPRNPVLLLGAVALGVAGVLAWRNRERIAERSRPLLDDARARAQPLLDGAMARGEALREKLPRKRR